MIGRFTTRATNSGPFMGLEPTGAPVEWTLVNTCRQADGLIAEEWVLDDMLTLTWELGALPPAS